jgi:hypothetical protein
MLAGIYHVHVSYPWHHLLIDCLFPNSDITHLRQAIVEHNVRTSYLLEDDGPLIIID